MATLATLKLVTAKHSNNVSPVQQRRNKIGKRIYEQILLAKAQQDGTQFKITKIRNTTDAETGERKQVELAKRVKQWWFTAENGKTVIAVRYGARVLEIAKGKFGIEVASNTEIVSTLEIIKDAVEAGELDAQMEATAGKLRKGFGK